jgi:hypothetical protein
MDQQLRRNISNKLLPVAMKMFEGVFLATFDIRRALNHYVILPQSRK